MPVKPIAPKKEEKALNMRDVIPDSSPVPYLDKLLSSCPFLKIKSE